VFETGNKCQSSLSLHRFDHKNLINKKLAKNSGEGNGNRAIFEKTEQFPFFMIFTPFFTSMNFVGCVTLNF
jgi:hypothetical protein